MICLTTDLEYKYVPYSEYELIGEEENRRRWAEMNQNNYPSSGRRQNTNCKIGVNFGIWAGWLGTLPEDASSVGYKYALAMTKGPVITMDCLPKSIIAPEPVKMLAEDPKLQPSLEQKRMAQESEEIQSIVNSLLSNNGNQTRAAKELGISRVTLWRRMKKYNIK